MKINILGINCSPRTGSNSRALLDHAFSRLAQRHPDEANTHILDLKDLTIEPCKACDECGKSRTTGAFLPCVTDDDMKHVLEKMRQADGIALATPVYFGLASDLFSRFIMRTRVLRHQDFALADKPVGILATAGRRSGGAETAIVSSWLPFVRHGCLIVGNGDKTGQFGTVAWAGGPGDVLGDAWGLEQAVDTVERIFRTARIVKAGREALGEGSGMTFSYTSGTRPK